MPVVLARIDDRLVHGQVVIGWGRPLAVDLIVLVDAEVAASDWEQEIYQMAVPEGMDILFLDPAEAAGRLTAWDASQSRVMPGPTLMPSGFRIPRKYSTWAPSRAAVRIPIQGKCVPRLNQPH